jgi:hypothetical protein
MGNVELALQVEPELGAIAEIAGESECRVGGHRPPSIQYVGDPARWHAEINGEALGAQVSGRQFAAENPARVDCGCHGLALVIIDNFHIIGIAIANHETDAPARVDCHCPLVPAAALQFVGAYALQRTQIIETLCEARNSIAASASSPRNGSSCDLVSFPGAHSPE